MHTCHGTCVEGIDQLVGVVSHLPPCGFWSLNSGPWAWRLVPLPAQLFCWPLLILCFTGRAAAVYSVYWRSSSMFTSCVMPMPVIEFCFVCVYRNSCFLSTNLRLRLLGFLFCFVFKLVEQQVSHEWNSRHSEHLWFWVTWPITKSRLCPGDLYHVYRRVCLSTLGVST